MGKNVYMDNYFIGLNRIPKFFGGLNIRKYTSVKRR